MGGICHPTARRKSEWREAGLSDHQPHHADHTRQLPRLRRIEGQVRGIAGMVEGGRYCVDILTQIQAARAALARVEREILDDHVAACVTAAAASGDAEATRAKMTELTDLLRRALR